MWLLLQR